MHDCQSHILTCPKLLPSTPSGESRKVQKSLSRSPVTEEVLLLRWCSHPESKRLLWNACLPLIFGLEKALVSAHPDERGPFRRSKTAEVPLITFLPRLFCRPREQAIGCVLETGRENSWPRSPRTQASIEDPFLLQSTDILKDSYFFQSPSIHPTVTVGRQLPQLFGTFKSTFYILEILQSR